MPRDQVAFAEESDAAYADLGPPHLADVYGVDLEWLSGRSELCDYAAVKKLDGAGKLSFRDRDQIAELLASRPKRASTLR